MPAPFDSRSPPPPSRRSRRSLAELFVSWSIRAGELSPSGSRKRRPTRSAARLEAAGLDDPRPGGRAREGLGRRGGRPPAAGRGRAVSSSIPTSPPSADPGGRRRLLLPAERAFGTGSHESTRLALRLLLVVGPRRGIRSRRRLRRGDARARRADRRGRAGVRIRPRPGGAAGLPRERPQERHRRVRVLGRASREPLARPRGSTSSSRTCCTKRSARSCPASRPSSARAAFS